IDGTNLRTLAIGSFTEGERDIAVNATHVYWVDDKAGLMRVPLGASAAAEVVTPTDYAKSIALDATSVYWRGWASGYEDVVMKGPIVKGDQVTLAVGQNSQDIVVDEAYVYLTGSQTVRKIAK